MIQTIHGIHGIHEHALYKFLLSVFDGHVSIICSYCYMAISWTTHFLLSRVAEALVMIFDSFTIVVY